MRQRPFTALRWRAPYSEPGRKWFVVGNRRDTSSQKWRATFGERSSKGCFLPMHPEQARRQLLRWQWRAVEAQRQTLHAHGYADGSQSVYYCCHSFFLYSCNVIHRTLGDCVVQIISRLCFKVLNCLYRQVSWGAGVASPRPCPCPAPSSPMYVVRPSCSRKPSFFLLIFRR